MRATIRTQAADRTRRQIQELALRQIAVDGPQALSLNAIAASLKMSGPAIYRYYRSRLDLLTDLVAESYRALTDAVADSSDVQDFTRAYRAWAVSSPHRYRLLFGPPLPGYDAHVAELVEASHGAMDVLLDCLAVGPVRPLPGSDTGELERWTKARGGDVPAAVAGRAVDVWAHLHGLVLLEINDNFASMGVNPESMYADVATAAG